MEPIWQKHERRVQEADGNVTRSIERQKEEQVDKKTGNDVWLEILHQSVV